MKTFLHRWRTMLLCLPAALVLVDVHLVCVGMIIHGLGVVTLDKTQFEYDHNLPRGYEYHTTQSLTTLQEATVEYAEHHKGLLPPMQNSNMAMSALKPYLPRPRLYSRNPATQILFTPNAALSGQKIGASGRNTVLFYDANPPAGYRESYYVGKATMSR